MENKLLIEIGLDGLPYNLYDIVIRNLKEKISKLSDENKIKTQHDKFIFSKNRIIFSIELNKDIKNTTCIENTIGCILNSIFIPVKELSVSNLLKDYIIWIQGMLNNEYLSFDDYKYFRDNKDNIPFYKIDSIECYTDTLKNNNIILENDARKDFLITKSKKLVKEYGGNLYDSYYLIRKYITGYNLPYPIIKKFDNNILEYPQKLLMAIMIDICNVFPVLNEKEQLMPYFVFCIEKHDIDNEVKINKIYNEKIEKIMSILLKFDNTMGNDYEYYVEKMKNTKNSFEVGSIYDKTIRLKDLSKIIGSYLNVGENTLSNIELESDICKLDLSTDLVIENPELKGVIGYLYAKDKDFNDIISNAVYMHYRPRFYGDEMPETTSAKVLSLSDKLDSILNIYIYNHINGKISEYQTIETRRLASGIINIIISNKWDLNLSDIIGDNIYIYIKRENIVMDYDLLKLEVKNFILGKLRDELISENFDYKLVDKLIEENPDNISKIYENLLKEI